MSLENAALGIIYLGFAVGGAAIIWKLGAPTWAMAMMGLIIVGFCIVYEQLSAFQDTLDTFLGTGGKE